LARAAALFIVATSPACPRRSHARRLPELRHQRRKRRVRSARNYEFFQLTFDGNFQIDIDALARPPSDQKTRYVSITVPHKPHRRDDQRGANLRQLVVLVEARGCSCCWSMKTYREMGLRVCPAARPPSLSPSVISVSSLLENLRLYRGFVSAG